MLQDNEKKGSRQAMKEDIITKILDRNNLNEAFKNVKANKGASGIDDLSIEETAEYIKRNKATIVWQLYNRKYQPQPVRRVEIPKPNGGTRKLGIPIVLDRVYDLAVISHLDVGGQLAVDLIMSTDMVAAVYQPRLACPYPTGKSNGFCNSLVRMVGLWTEGVHYQHVTATGIGHLFVSDGFHVRDVG